MVVGSVPMQAASGPGTLPFRIKGEINKVAVRGGLFAKKGKSRTGEPVSGTLRDHGRVARNLVK
jgi:hypothetical protein